MKAEDIPVVGVVLLKGQKLVHHSLQVFRLLQQFFGFVHHIWIDKCAIKRDGQCGQIFVSVFLVNIPVVCSECGTPYHRCTWTVKGEKKPVWRCINRLDFGKKYCHHSPTMEESVLQEAIMMAITRTAKQSADVLGTLKLHIGMGLKNDDGEDNRLDIQIRIAEIDVEFKAMLQAIATDTVEDFDEQKATELMAEKNSLEQQLAQYGNVQQEKENTQSRLDEIFTILEGLEIHPMEYDDQLVRQVLECVVVESKDKIKVIFAGGLEVEQAIEKA